MRLTCAFVLLMLGPGAVFAQLTLDQKLADFEELAALYAKRYGPYEWKRDAFKVDLLNIAPWLDKVRAGKDDLDFYEVMSEYVASLNDAHDVFQLPSNFTARLNFGVDLYDGKLLVDSINRTRLPAAEFGFLNGYELVSIDGQDAQKLLDTLLRYQIAANDRSTRRFAATLLTVRPQVLMPHAAEVPDISSVVLRRPDGKLETYRIPWTKTGVPLTAVGKYPTPGEVPKLTASTRTAAVSRRSTATRKQGPETESEPDAINPPKNYPEVLRRLQTCRVPRKEVIGFGALTPVFAQSLPANFVQRLPKLSTDVFYSGVFEAEGLKIGYIRIPDYEPADELSAVLTFQREIAYFQANTDGLIVDDMRNPGGYGSYANELMSLLMPTKWRSIPFEVRPTAWWIYDISTSLEQAKAAGQDPEIIDLLQAIKDELIAANREDRGRTKPIPLDDVTIDREPLLDSKGNAIAYTKPVMVLIDEMSASAAEVFAGTFQDNGRGLLFGWRTMGAGGNVEAWSAGSYGLGITTVTESLMIRKNPITTSELPSAPYVENIGVRPDLPADYMTAENLRKNGKPFVDAFTAAMVQHIRKSK